MPPCSTLIFDPSDIVMSPLTVNTPPSATTTLPSIVCRPVQDSVLVMVWVVLSVGGFAPAFGVIQREVKIKHDSNIANGRMES